jgi:hypothetical protein
VAGSGDTTGGGGESGAVEPVTLSGDAAAPDPCSYQLAQPQPPTGSAIWAGHGPEDGAIWLLICPRLSGTAPGGWIGLVFLPTGADPPAGPRIDPRAVAAEAISSMAMRAPEIRMAPPPGSASGLVGLPVWMWTERGEQITGPTEASASAGGVTVTAVGQVDRVVWDMGDGTTVVCGAGTPYQPGATGESPDCGHV